VTILVALVCRALVFSTIIEKRDISYLAKCFHEKTFVKSPISQIRGWAFLMAQFLENILT
jgi:hypothetical protein